MLSYFHISLVVSFRFSRHFFFFFFFASIRVDSEMKVSRCLRLVLRITRRG